MSSIPLPGTREDTSASKGEGKDGCRENHPLVLTLEKSLHGEEIIVFYSRDLCPCLMDPKTDKKDSDPYSADPDVYRKRPLLYSMHPIPKGIEFLNCAGRTVGSAIDNGLVVGTGLLADVSLVVGTALRASKEFTSYGRTIFERPGEPDTDTILPPNRPRYEPSPEHYKERTVSLDDCFKVIPGDEEGREVIIGRKEPPYIWSGKKDNIRLQKDSKEFAKMTYISERLEFLEIDRSLVLDKEDVWISAMIFNHFYAG